MEELILTTEQSDFVISSLNAFWHQAMNELDKKDLGDIERKNYEYQRDKAKEIMRKLGAF